MIYNNLEFTHAINVNLGATRA